MLNDEISAELHSLNIEFQEYHETLKYINATMYHDDAIRYLPSMIATLSKLTEIISEKFDILFENLTQ